MSANITDKVTDTRNAARPVSTTATGTRAAGASSLACNSLTGWPTASKVHFVTYRIDSNSDPVAGTQLDCYGIVSGNSITSFTVVDGNDVGNSVGDVVEMLPTAAWGQGLADALMAEHSRTGTHTNITATSGNFSGTVSADTIAEHTGGSGVTAGGVLLKNNTISTASAVSNTSLSAGMIAQVVGNVTGAVATGTTTIPYDDTIPQNNEGDQYLSQAITPKSATNILVIDVTLQASYSVIADVFAALFQDTTANALAVGNARVEVNTARAILRFQHIMVAGTTSSTTFKVRAGSNTAGTFTLNGNTGARKFGGVMTSGITIWEYKA